MDHDEIINLIKFVKKNNSTLEYRYNNPEEFFLYLKKEFNNIAKDFLISRGDITQKDYFMIHDFISLKLKNYFFSSPLIDVERFVIYLFYNRKDKEFTKFIRSMIVFTIKNYFPNPDYPLQSSPIIISLIDEYNRTFESTVALLNKIKKEQIN